MDQLRDPIIAAAAAAIITAGYLYFKARINNESKTNSAFLKPALLNAVMVYFIVSYGCGQKPRIMTEPY